MGRVKRIGEKTELSTTERGSTHLGLLPSIVQELLIFSTKNLIRYTIAPVSSVESREGAPQRTNQQYRIPH